MGRFQMGISVEMGSIIIKMEVYIKGFTKMIINQEKVSILAPISIIIKANGKMARNMAKASNRLQIWKAK